MPTNVEVKAKISDSEKCAAFFNTLTNRSFVEVKQEDTFYTVKRGRLKMRCDTKGVCELIYYNRENKPGPGLSNYYRQSLSNASKSMVELKFLFGIKSIVRKKRILYLIDDMQIHLDKVEGLGDFIEIEIPVKTNFEILKARNRAKYILNKLKIRDDQITSESYDDMLSR